MAILQRGREAASTSCNLEAVYGTESIMTSSGIDKHGTCRGGNHEIELVLTVHSHFGQTGKLA